MPVLRRQSFKSGSFGQDHRAARKTFEADKIKEAKQWYLLQEGPLTKRCTLPVIHCPFCKHLMYKCIHTETSRAVVDQCTNDACAAIWCDAHELEQIQMLIENPGLNML